MALLERHALGCQVQPRLPGLPDGSLTGTVLGQAQLTCPPWEPRFGMSGEGVLPRKVLSEKQQQNVQWARPAQGDWSHPISVCPQVSVSTEQENKQKENTMLASELPVALIFLFVYF